MSRPALRRDVKVISGGRYQTRINRRDADLLQAKGSLYVTRLTLIHYSATREDYVGLANELFDVVKSGKVKIPVNQTYPLEKAHRDLESRGTTGSSILTP